jgi:hypothetical protein
MSQKSSMAPFTVLRCHARNATKKDIREVTKKNTEKIVKAFSIN